jgi:hypothetical protein
MDLLSDFESETEIDEALVSSNAAVSDAPTFDLLGGSDSEADEMIEAPTALALPADHDYDVAVRQAAGLVRAKCPMRNCKAKQRMDTFQDEIGEVLASLQSHTARQSGLLNLARCVSSGGIKLTIVKRKLGGNRFVQSIAYSCFLEASFGKCKQNQVISAVHGVSRRTVNNMRVATANTVMKQQSVLLGRLALLSKASPPLATVVRLKWDETGILIKLNPGDFKSGAQRSTWQIVIARLAIAVTWHTGASVFFNMVRVFRTVHSLRCHMILFYVVLCC